MYIVPLAGDVIMTTEGAAFEVISYTNYKQRGPAVYVSATGDESTTPAVVYFFDITKICGVHVEYDNSTKIFKASGKIKRKYHLPQPGDKITVLKPETPLDEDDDQIKIEKLKLHNKSEGIAKGLLACGDACYMLNDIISIDRVIGSDSFDRKKFQRLYSDYSGNHK